MEKASLSSLSPLPAHPCLPCTAVVERHRLRGVSLTFSLTSTTLWTQGKERSLDAQGAAVPYSTRTGIPCELEQTGGWEARSLPRSLFPKEHWRLRLGFRDKSEMASSTEASRLALGSLLGVLGRGNGRREPDYFSGNKTGPWS